MPTALSSRDVLPGGKIQGARSVRLYGIKWQLRNARYVTYVTIVSRFLHHRSMHTRFH